MSGTVFRATRALAMQPTRMAFMQPTRMAFLRMQPTRVAFMRQTAWNMSPVPKNEHAAHGISHRLRQLKKMPAELIPLCNVALGAAVFSIIRKFMTDKTLRLKRQGRTP
ncbi:hypothetical protein EJ04DRAFT_481429 [Polyplosphaeria fusca]|uniref:Uncharacterized protein n=1 Tax=Polyplosphaeria fusca TaxID=682080 RepID=A0A9P4RAD1_9PLEO|nr:hypothetical protein EJ04DRAFT_481429 [Polyplosphaeria fusca]